jgi:hypothetical protein
MLKYTDTRISNHFITPNCKCTTQLYMYNLQYSTVVYAVLNSLIMAQMDQNILEA